ncbi:MAG: hypothetical protein ABFD82_14735 [Syntrophaceae bacterium]
MNLLKDVMLVQYLLNCVPEHHGGPSVELVIDGIAGPKTTEAIRRFQTVRLGFADSLVAPNGPTLRELQKFDPYPNEPFNEVEMKWKWSTSTRFNSTKGSIGDWKDSSAGLKNLKNVS